MGHPRSSQEPIWGRQEVKDISLVRHMQAYMAEHIFTLTTYVSSKSRLGSVWQWQLAASYSSNSGLPFSSVFLPYSLKPTVAHYLCSLSHFCLLLSIFHVPWGFRNNLPTTQQMCHHKPKSFQVNFTTITTTACENANCLHVLCLISKLTALY